MRLNNSVPVDHRLVGVYRVGAGIGGVALLIFGVFGFFDQVGFFSTSGDRIAGLSTNGALSLISVVIGAILIGGAVVGGNTASNINMTVGVLFLLSGFVNTALLDTSNNFLAFRMQNVIFSFVMGLILLVFGMYGRVSGALPHNNPYWQARHPDAIRRENEERQRIREQAAFGQETPHRQRPRPQATHRQEPHREKLSRAN